jgi:hypothetical protein
MDNENVSEYVPENILKLSYAIYDPVRTSDHIRLYVLKEHGGIWIDISSILTKGIEFYNNTICDQLEKGIKLNNNYEFNGYYINHLSDGVPVVENWFIAAKKNSRIMKMWFDEYISISNHKSNNILCYTILMLTIITCFILNSSTLKSKHYIYVLTIYILLCVSFLFYYYRHFFDKKKEAKNLICSWLDDNKDYVHDSPDSTYLSQHACIIKLMRNHPEIMNDMCLKSAKDGPFKLHADLDWKAENMNKDVILNSNLPYIKLRGCDRKYL